jgi:putative FmdB family regulatory protein
MPIYEFRCRSCGHHFEALVRGLAPPLCPACEGQDLERLLSMFAVSSEGSKAQALKDGRRRSALLRRDKDHAQLEYEKQHDH